MFHVYILRCRDGSLYVGHTDDLEKRMTEHAEGVASAYTFARRPFELVWTEEFGRRDEAFERERRIKGWVRRKKEALIRGDVETLRCLARGPNRHERG